MYYRVKENKIYYGEYRFWDLLALDRTGILISLALDRTGVRTRVFGPQILFCRFHWVNKNQFNGYTRTGIER